jgi:hypothetical protein
VFPVRNEHHLHIKIKAIPVIGRGAIGVLPVRYEHYLHMKKYNVSLTDSGGPYGCEMYRLPHFLDSWFTDGTKFASLICRTHYP